MKKDAKILTVRLDILTDSKLEKAAIGEQKTKSAIIRRYIEQGLKSDGYKLDDERFYQMVKQAVHEEIKPQIERLAAISAKATHISAAAFFMEIYQCRLSLDAADRFEVDGMAERARKLGIEYLKLKDSDIDGFIAGSAKKMNDEK